MPPERLQTVEAASGSLARIMPTADLLITAVLVAGRRTPVVATSEMVRSKPLGSVVVGISIDQDGPLETSRPTTASDPVCVEHNVTHFAVTNMPAAVARTATQALTSRTASYVAAIAGLGLRGVLARYPELRPGLTTLGGEIVQPTVAQALGLSPVDPGPLLAAA